MTLTPARRKELLGRGGLSRVARSTRRTAGHVTEVNAVRRRDEKVEQAITRTIQVKHPALGLEHADIWPPVEGKGGGDAAQQPPLARPA